MRRFMHDYDVGICDLDYCQFGELWKNLRDWHINLSSWIAFHVDALASMVFAIDHNSHTSA